MVVPRCVMEPRRRTTVAAPSMSSFTLVRRRFRVADGSVLEPAVASVALAAAATCTWHALTRSTSSA